MLGFFEIHSLGQVGGPNHTSPIESLQRKHLCFRVGLSLGDDKMIGVARFFGIRITLLGSQFVDLVRDLGLTWSDT